MTTKPSAHIHPLLQVLLIFAIVFVLIIFGTAIAGVIITLMYGTETLLNVFKFNMADPHVLTGLWILQIISTTLPILITPIFYSYVIARDPENYLRPSLKFPWPLMIIVFACMFIISPAQEFLSNINQKMVLPDYLKGIEEWMQQSEKQIEKVQEAMLNMQTLGQMFFALFIVAFVTAIAEELLFRGCIQTMLTKATKNAHASIWITATLFSAFHMEFYGFLPRLLLGVLFGYFVVWSGSIWPAIWGHFINNGTAVVVTYLYQHKKVTINPSDQHFFGNWAYLISILITLFLLFVYRTISLNKKPQYL